MIGIVDYGMGNLYTIQRKFIRINVSSIISDDINELEKCEKLILPGVGHFGKAMFELRQRNLLEFLNDFVLTQKMPVLGICLGMQLMAKHSEEGDVKGLGWIDAQVIRFRISNTVKYKVPHVGWNDIEIKRQTSLFESVNFSSGFYFVHAYHLVCENSDDILCETEYEYPFVSAIMRNNILGMQFHPEKSHDSGEQILTNFARHDICSDLE